MKRNKELFFEYKDNKANLKKFIKEPVSFSHFIEVVNELKNINLDSQFIESFYQKYKNDLFINITSKDPSQYSKYFWNSDCLGLNHPTSSDDFYISRGWNQEQIKELRKSKYATGTIEFQTNQLGLSESEASEKLNKRQAIIKSKRKETYKEYLKEDPNYFKKKCGYSIDHFIDKGFSKEESEIKSKESALKVSTKNKQWAKDKKISDPVYWNSRTETQLQYWINKGYSVDNSKILLKDRQITFSLEKCIKKYGEIVGKNKWTERQIKWKAKVFNSTTYLGGGSSMVSNMFFKELIKILNLKEYEYLFDKNEKCIRVKNTIRAYKYDFCHIQKRRIIEFNGDYWHCNPEIYEPSYYHKIKKMSADQIWEYDKEKIKLAESHGYRVLHVTELDYKRDPETILNNCIQFLTK